MKSKRSRKGSKKKTVFESKAIPVRLSGEIIARLDALAEKIGEQRSTVMRMALRLGLEAFEKCEVSPEAVQAGLKVSEEESESVTIHTERPDEPERN